MQISAVKTTGIYCRADCAARPLAENVRPLRSVVEALAHGFRPCLRCRPDRVTTGAATLAAVDDRAPVEVERALRMITEGYLDDHTTDELAARVSYSTRQLVRLFDEHVGASPDFVARVCRAHIARRLFDETDLTMTHVAYAAGFASVRQMNRVVRELFGFTPTELRAKRSRRDLLEPLDGGLRLRVPFAGALASDVMLHYLSSRAIPGVETVTGGHYLRTMSTCGAPGVAEIKGVVGSLEVTLHLGTFASILEQVARARSLFGVREDSTAAEEKLCNDPILGRWVERYPGVRLPGAWDPFETAVRIILGQQVSVQGASTLAGRWASRFGEPIAAPLPDGLDVLFPTAQRLADVAPKDLGIPEARARAIQALARAVAAGEISLCGDATATDTVSVLRALPGIGPWSSELIAARVLGDPDAFPESDLGLRRVVSELVGAKKPLPPREVGQIAEAWRPFRATAAAYLWMSRLLERSPGVASESSRRNRPQTKAKTKEVSQ